MEFCLSLARPGYTQFREPADKTPPALGAATNIEVEMAGWSQVHGHEMRKTLLTCAFPIIRLQNAPSLLGISDGVVASRLLPPTHDPLFVSNAIDFVAVDGVACLARCVSRRLCLE
jgi:hypothetical protein